MNATKFKVGDKVRIIPKDGNTNITYDNGELDTIVKISGDRALINYWGDVGEDWWGLDELVPYAEETQDELAKLRMRNMELEAALDVTTESLNKANYEKYLLELEIAKMKDQLQAVRNAANMAEINQILQNFDDGIELEVVKNLKLQFAYAQGMAEGTKRTLFNEALTIKSLNNMIEFFSKITGIQSFDSVTEQVPVASDSDEEYYSVRETVETRYIPHPHGYDKRVPEDYSVFTVYSPTGKPVESFSALEHGLDNAEFKAFALRDKLNKGV